MSYLNSGNRTAGLSFRDYLLVSVISVAALCGTFVIAVSAIGFYAKLWAFAAVLASLVGVLFGSYKRAESRSKKMPEVEAGEDHIFTKSIDEKIGILDEAAKFFSASLKSDDMFRLVASRIGEIIPHSACVLFLVSKENKLKATYASGENSRAITKLLLECDEGLAGAAFIAGEVQIDPLLDKDRKLIDRKILEGFGSGLAAPLIRGVETFGVLSLYGAAATRYSEKDKILLETVSNRVAPLLISSFAFEQNISASMTDSLTNLPNERAFYLVLENQIAEAQRFQKERPLTILTIDIKEFAQFNRLYGHSTGDKLLTFASSIIEDNLRQMDFLCRSMNDEFWVVLPTASDAITKKIVARIEGAFESHNFVLPGDKNYKTGINVGSATFLRDGETTNQLLQKALLRKKQVKKSTEDSTVIMFPREYVN